MTNIQFYDINKQDKRRSRRLDNYIRARLALVKQKPLNTAQLVEALQLLQIDPLIDSISAELSPGTKLGENILVVQYREANSFHAFIGSDNGRSPSVASFQRQLTLRKDNLLGFGDSISLGYFNTDGSNDLEFSYAIPFNPHNGMVSFSYRYTNNNIIEAPFDDIDGDGSSPDLEYTASSYEITVRQPIMRTIENQTFQEFALGLSTSFDDTQSFLLNTPFPLSPGADGKGRTRIFVLGFSQDWTLQSASQAIALRSQFNLGLGALGSTLNEQIEGVDAIPDSRFFLWRFQSQYVWLFAPNSLFVVRSSLQLADRTLVPLEQFSLGGFGTVRGYRQDQLLTDNGLFVSTEVRLPILQKGQHVVQFIPFFDFGTGWNSSGLPAPDPSSLASVGLGLQWQIDNNFSVRFDWGIPLIDVESRPRTWQENGLYFSVQYSPF